MDGSFSILFSVNRYSPIPDTSGSQTRGHNTLSAIKQLLGHTFQSIGYFQTKSGLTIRKLVELKLHRDRITVLRATKFILLKRLLTARLTVFMNILGQYMAQVTT